MKYFIMRVCILLLFFIFTSPLIGQPAHDLCSGATPLTLTLGSTTSVSDAVDTATDSGVMPGCTSGDAVDLWYSFTSPVTGNISVTGMSSFTTLAVYDACGGTVLDCESGSHYIPVQNGNQYIVQAIIRTFASGPIRFTMEPFEAPANDDCASAPLINLSVGVREDISVEMRGASNSGPSAPSCETNDFVDAWYELDMPVQGNIYVNNTSVFLKYALYDACAGAEIYCGSGTDIILDLAPGRYFLRLIQREIFPGTETISLEPFAKVANDDCSQATPYVMSSGVPISITGDLRGALDDGPSPPSCRSGPITDQWYSFVADTSGNLGIAGNSSLFYTALYDGCSSAELGCMSGNGLYYNVVKGSTYYLRVLSSHTLSGAFTIDVTNYPRPSNNDCAQAAPLTLTEGSCTQEIIDLRGAQDNGMQAPSCNSAEITDAYYSITMPFDGNLFFSFGSTFDIVSIYDACNGTELACLDNLHLATNLVGGQSYIVRVHRRVALSGLTDFCVEPYRKIDNDECASADTIVATVACDTTYYAEMRAATASSNPLGTCQSSSISYTDAWYYLEAPGTGDLDVSSGSIFTGFTFYDACNGTELACFQGSGTATGLQFGQPLWLKVWRRIQFSGTSNFCLSGALDIADPAELSCEAAVSVMVGAAQGNDNSWVPLLNGAGELMAAINAQGQDLGTVSATLKIDSADTRLIGTTHYLAREVEISTTSTFSSPIRVRVYFLDHEFSALVDAIPDLMRISQVNAMKEEVSGCTDGYGGSGVYLSSSGRSYGLDYYIETSVNELSTFFPTSSNLNEAFPVQYLSWDVSAEADYTLLDWRTASEQNALRFDIQRSGDTEQWETIGSVGAAGWSSTPQQYRYEDEARSGKTYYRLAQVDIDGAVDHSLIRSVTRAKTGPRARLLSTILMSSTLEWEQAVDTPQDVQIRDLNGQPVPYTVLSDRSVALQGVSSGVYFVLYKSGGEHRVERFIVQ